MLSAFQNADPREAFEAAEGLLGWIDGGGFPPDFTQFSAEEKKDLTAIVCFGVMSGCQVAKRIQT
jgi:hypothetical protein